MTLKQANKELEDILVQLQEATWSSGIDPEFIDAALQAINELMISKAEVETVLGELVEFFVGERCKTKDTEDFPELKWHHSQDTMTVEGNDGRCLVCVTYEKVDKLNLKTPPHQRLYNGKQ